MTKQYDKVANNTTVNNVMNNLPRLSPSPIDRSPTRSSPYKSPSKDRIYAFATSPIKLSLSPVKTPKGRAGLPSPQKRTLEDLNGSAVKRAVRTRISTTLDSEDNEDSFLEEELNNQDLELAEAIIRESRGEGITSIEHYGSQIPLEDDDDDNDGDDNDGERDDDNKPRTRGKKIKYELSSEDDDEEEDAIISQSSSDEGDGDSTKLGDLDTVDEPENLSDTEYGSPNVKRGRGRPRKPISESPILPSDLPSSLNRRRKYVIAGKEIGSIFQTDDQTLFVSNSTTKKEPVVKKEEELLKEVEKKTNKDSSLKTLFSLGLMDATPKIPSVTGIEKIETTVDSKEVLELLPVPRLVGGAIPKEYIQEHLSEINWDAEPINEAADDRAYFVDGTEGYFDQLSNRDRHSVMSLSSLGITLNQEEFQSSINILKDFKRKEIDTLAKLHTTLHHQWCFEISQGFNLCYYGLGSKIKLLNGFASGYLVLWLKDFYKLDDSTLPKISVINGYNPSFKLRDLFEFLLTTLLPPEQRYQNGSTISVAESIPYLVKQVNRARVDTELPKPKLIMLVHCIDAEPMRDDRLQVFLSQLASLPEIVFLASVETINFPLLWDLYKTENFKFLYHDLTTYEPYLSETSFKDVINLGKTKRTQSSRGAKFVLSALNENSKKMYKILLTLQLDKIRELNPKHTLQTSRGNLRTSIDFKTYHTKCIEQFITPNEISFRSMLTEFIEHNMSTLTKDEAGNEKLYIPYTVEEMEKLIRESFRD